MNKVLSILTFFFSIVILFSCEPNRDTNGDYLIGVTQPGGNGGGSGGGTGSTKLLKKMTSVDIDGAVSTFTYNYTAGVLTSANLDDDGDKSDFAFSYKDNKLSQFIMNNSDGTNIITTTVNLVYNNGILVSSFGNMESGGEEATKNNTIYTYNAAGKISKIVTSLTGKDLIDPNNYTEKFNIESNVIFNGDNMSSWKMTVKAITPPPVTIDPIVSNIKFSNYDTKKNPLATLPYELNLAGAHFLTSSNSILGLSTNNYGTAVATTNVDTQTANFTFVYDNDGYPTSATSAQGTLNYEYQ